MSRYTKSMTDALQQVDDRTQEFDEEVKWEVKITGLPTFYSDGKSRGEVKQALRKLLKRPDDIVSIERTTPAELKKIRRGQASGSDPEDKEDKEQVKEEVKINRIIQAQNENLSVDDVINMIQFGHPFKVTEEIPAELPGPEVPRYKNASNATVDKEDKKANKVKDKIEKGTLIPTQTKESKSNLPDHLAKFLDKKGNPNPEAAKRIEAGRKKRAADAAKPKITDVTPKGYGPSEEVELDEVTPGEHKARRGVKNVPGDKGDRTQRPDVRRLTKDFPKKPEQEYERKRRLKKASGLFGDKPTSRLQGPKGKLPEEVELAIMSLDHKEAPRKLKITQKGLDALRKDRDRPKVKTQVKITKAGRAAVKDDPIRPMDEWGDTSILSTQRARIAGRPDIPKKKAAAQAKDKKNQNKDPVGPQHEMADRLLKKLREVAPPRWGHTVPDKPKGAKVGGTAQAMKKAQERGDIPKDMNIYALMWSMKNKGDNPHYKPGEKDVLKKKYKKNESVLDSAKRYVIDERADWETAFKSASQSRPAMKYKDAAAFIDTAGLSSTEKRTALKSAKKWLK